MPKGIVLWPQDRLEGVEHHVSLKDGVVDEGAGTRVIVPYRRYRYVTMSGRVDSQCVRVDGLERRIWDSTIGGQMIDGRIRERVKIHDDRSCSESSCASEWICSTAGRCVSLCVCCQEPFCPSLACGHVLVLLLSRGWAA